MSKILPPFTFAVVALILLFAALFTDTAEPQPTPRQQTATPSRGTDRTITCEATAYDLSIQCCGKSIGNPARGITKEGYDLNGKSRIEAMTISSNDFPFGTKLEISFDQTHNQYNGIYTVRDTGNMPPGVIDIFVGDYGEQVNNKTINFGRTSIKVEVIN